MKGMLRHNKGLIRIVLSFVLALSLIGLICTAVYAAYTHSLYAQRTFAPYEVGIRFSSNYLIEEDDNGKRNLKVIYTSSDEINPTAVLTVCNYDQGRQTEYQVNNVTYTFAARYVKKVNGQYTSTGITIPTTYTPEGEDPVNVNYGIAIKKRNASFIDLSNVGANSELSATVGNNTLEGGKASSDVYEIIFNKDLVKYPADLYLEIIVTPSDESLPTLGGIFKAELRTESTVVDEWDGVFIDNQTRQVTVGGTTRTILPSDYDGFNYVVSGFGSGTVTITWDRTKIEMSYISLQELLDVNKAGATYSEVNDGNTHTSTVIFDVDSNVTSRYEIQFYKVNLDNISWDGLANTVVRFDFE